MSDAKKNPMEKHLANPASRKYAINAMCWDCSGGDAPGNSVTKNIKECPITTCPLWAFRPYKEEA